jgi:hypothetical protein
MAGRFGSGLGTFFFGFLTSRLPLSLFPMPHRMPQLCNFATGAKVREPERKGRKMPDSNSEEPAAAKHFELLRR